jgi:ribosomal protein S27E
MVFSVTEDEFKKIIADSPSAWKAIRALGKTSAKSFYQHLYKEIVHLGCSIDHWHSKQFLPGKRPKQTLAEVTVWDSTCSPRNLKRKLVEEGVLQDKCIICGLDQWLGKPITLHLDHINGINTDNRIENVRILCPNCHQQTDTWGHRHRAVKPRCLDCGVLLKQAHSKRCNRCAGSAKAQCKIDWPTTEILLDMLAKNNGNFLALSRQIGVSDNAIRKRIRLHPVRV